MPDDTQPTSSRRAFLHSTAAALGTMALRPGMEPFARGYARLATRDSRLQLPDAMATDLSWWREARFGMFIHWGLYSILAGEWGGRTDYAEWIRNLAHIPIGEYDKLVARFNPAAFDADRWVSLARQAGMGYLTITTKHHDGFCLFDSKLTDFCVRSTPFKRDIMREIATACRRQGIRPCWYHSIMDWHHPDYLPRRDWEAESRPVGKARFANYLPYLHGQVSELLTNYGDIGVMWFDGQWEGTWTHEAGRALYQKCKALQPGVIVNNRVEGWSPVPIADPLGDFRTPEQEIPATGWPGVDWESCITMNDNWGFNSHDHNFKSVARLIGMLVETASKGGNLLLNIGPKSDGTFPEESVERLEAIGRWMAVNGTAIHGTSASPFAHSSFRATSKGNQLFLFVADWSGRLDVPGLRTPIRKAYLLADPGRQALQATSGEGGAAITLPPTPPDPICSVVVLEFDRVPAVENGEH
ncbi:MAG TPA: alpha-L-fucosidase [Gemmatimonadales bacterium]|nr:alpha-L-fucosidase [Gemmatimonadales bacterium]